MLLLLLLRRFEHFIVVNLSSAKKRQMSLRVSLALSQCLGRLAPIARCHSPFNAIPPTTHRPPRPVEKCANGSPVDPVPHSMFAILPTSAALLCTNFAMPNGWGMGGICAARDALAKRERESGRGEKTNRECALIFPYCADSHLLILPSPSLIRPCISLALAPWPSCILFSLHLFI